MKLRIVLDIDADVPPIGEFAGLALREYMQEIAWVYAAQRDGCSVVACSIWRRPERTSAPSPLLVDGMTIDPATGEVLV